MNETMRLDGTRMLFLDLLGREQRASGRNQDAAREFLAERIGIAPGTLFNLFRGRLKQVKDSWYRPLVAYIIKDLEADLERTQRKLETARTLGASPDAETVRRLESIGERTASLLAEFQREAAR